MHSLTSSTSTSVPISWVEKLFARFEALYGRKFIDMWEKTDLHAVKELWAEEMGKLSCDELKRGYASLMQRQWPPTLPEFLNLCRPPIDATVAYYEAVNGIAARERGEKGEWRHPAIFWAAAPMAYDLRNLSYSAVKAHWEQSLSEQLAKTEWEPIPVPVLALPVPKARASKEQAEAMLRQLGNLKLGGGNHTRWIEKVFQRAKAGDSSLPGISLKMAQQALQELRLTNL